jgi:hypothetical protein
VNGKPFVAIYRPGKFPDISQTLRTWRNRAQQLGIEELYIGYMQGFQLKEDPAKLGFDVAVDFQPDFYTTLPLEKGSLSEQMLNLLKIKPSAYSRNRVLDYSAYVKTVKNLSRPSYKQFPCITPMWDNTARRKEGAFIMDNSSPAVYEEWLQHIADTFKSLFEEENFIFINAWNEWAEGNHLEPCMKWGRAYLEATKRVIGNE